MILDLLVVWLIYGLVVLGISRLLNATAFKSKPASRLAAWSLAITMFFINMVALSALKLLRYWVVLGESGGTAMWSRNPLDLVGAIVFAWLLFWLLRRPRPQRS